VIPHPGSLDTHGSEGLVPLVILEVIGRRVALVAEAVIEVLPIVWVSPLPKAPPVVEGVIDFRGKVVPVLDLRARFGRPSSPPVLNEHLVVVKVAGRKLALHVDRAVGLETVPAEDIDSAALPEVDYAAGVARLANDLLLVHDLGAFLWADEGLALDAALAESGRPLSKAQ